MPYHHVFLHYFPVLHILLVCYIISWKLVTICTDLRHIRSYSWASLILDHLHLGLKKKKKKNDKDVALSGCLPLIMYWLAEKTNINGRIEGHQTIMKPTFICWSLIKNQINLSFLYVTTGDV